MGRRVQDVGGVPGCMQGLGRLHRDELVADEGWLPSCQGSDYLKDHRVDHNQWWRGLHREPHSASCAI
jgi:hypothetical protein